MQMWRMAAAIPSHLSATAFRKAVAKGADELFHQALQRLLVRDVQEQGSGEIRVKPIVTYWFHNGNTVRSWMILAIRFGLKLRLSIF